MANKVNSSNRIKSHAHHSHQATDLNASSKNVKQNLEMRHTFD